MASSEPPWRIKTKPCPFYSKGRCLFSDSCNFLHNVKATTSADAFAAAYADHENTSISSYTLPHKEMDNVPLVTVNSPASSFRSSPRSPRMSGLLMALGDVISSDEEDEEEEDELHSAVENSETLVEDGEESTMVEGFSSFLEHYGRRHSTESTDSVLGVSSSVFDSEDDDETTNSIIFPAADENDAPDSANSDTLFPSHDDDDDTTQYYTALYSPLFSGPTAYTSEEAEPVDTVHPVLEPIAEHGPSSPVGNEHAYAEFLSPVEMSPAPLRNFSRDYCESGLRREDSIDSGYADSWTGPTPFRMSPPTQNPHRSSTFDLLASPFGSPAVRILSPRLGAFHVQSHPPPFFTPITGAAPGNSADGENVTPTPGSGKQYSDLDSDLGEPEHYSLESEDGGEDSSQEDDTVTTLAEASNASVHELDTNQAVENSVDHVSPETFDAGVVVAGGPAHSLSEPSDPPVAANAKSLFDDSGIEISPDTSDNRAAGYTSDDNPHLSRFIFPSDRVIQNYDSAVSVDPLDVGIATDASTAIPDKSHPPLHHNDDPSTEDFEDDVLDSSVAQDASFDENDTNMDVSRLLLPASRVDADESMEEYEGDVTANSFDNTMTTDASADDDTDPDLSRLLFPLPPTSHSQGSPSSMTSSARHLSYEVMTAALVKRERAVSELTISAVTDDGSEPSMPTMLEMIVDEEAPNSPELLSSADPTIRQADFSASSPRDERDTLVSLYTSYSDLEEEDEEDEKEADPDDTFHCADANKVQATPAHESVDLVDSAISHLAHPTDDSVDPDESFHSEDATDKFSRALSELSQRLSKGAGGLAFLDSGREESPRLQSSPPSRPRSRQSRKSSTSTSIPAYPPYVASRDPNLTLEAEDAGAVESKGSSNESYDIRPRSLQSRRSSPSTSAAYPSYVASHDPDLTLEAEDTEAVEPEGSSNESYDILNSIFDGNDSPVAQPDVSVVVSPDQRRTPNPSVFSPESTAGARTPLLPSTSRAPSPTVTPGSARARVFTPPPFNRERSGTIVPTPTEQHRRLHSAGSSGDHERVFTPPPLPRGRTGTIIATESNSSRPVSLASPRTPLSASSRGRSPITAAAPAKSPVDSEPSTKVPFGFRRSTTFGHVQNSPLLSNRSSQSIPPSSSRTRPAVATDFSPSTRSRASSPLNPSTTSRSGSPSNGNTHESHRPHSPSTSAARRLKPLRLSSILDSSSPSSQSAFVTASSPMLSSRPSSISYKPDLSKRFYMSSATSVSSGYSLSNNPLLSSAHPSTIPEHVRNTLVPARTISPLFFGSDTNGDHLTNLPDPSDEPQSAPISHSQSWRDSSSVRSSVRNSRFSYAERFSRRASSRLSEPVWGGDDDSDDEDFQGLAYDETTICRPVLHTAPSTRPTSVLHSPVHAIATPRPTLMFAIASDDPEQVRRVLESGEAGPNDQVGPQSALAFTLTNDQLTHKMEIVKALLAYGADPSALKNPEHNPPRSDSRLGSNDGDGSPTPTPPPPTMLEGMDPATRYYVARADAPHTRRTSALIHRSFFRPLTRLRYDLIGQDRAIEQLFRVLSMHSQKLSIAPIVVLFCGPSGHGKSLLARKFGHLLDVPTHTVNMTTLRSNNDLWQSYSMSPYEEPSKLTLAEFLKENEGKRCVVVLDEIEKVEDEKTLCSLLMPWELGRCSPEAGSRHIDVRNVVWLGTSNVGHDLVFEHHAERPNRDELMSREEYVDLMGLLRPRVSKRLGASLLSRVTTVLPFVPFSMDERMAIAAEAIHTLAGEMVRTMPPRKVESMVLGAVTGYVPTEGARSLYRAVSSQLMDTI